MWFQNCSTYACQFRLGRGGIVKVSTMADQPGGVTLCSGQYVVSSL